MMPAFAVFAGVIVSQIVMRPGLTAFKSKYRVAAREKSVDDQKFGKIFPGEEMWIASGQGLKGGFFRVVFGMYSEFLRDGFGRFRIHSE